ncbi:DUF1311 domain-containing protein [Acinetobacter sp. 187]|uniref:DUF1311 domain-containing protein n=1 Tax=Acinetobacter lanii TaxID=2715163 RepID=UPI00140864B7|nr:DUF1311 domain-containing protein [Acinetobacter lanii]NHC02274.1 DUF1311 domain-containing protein [Acinetobacter lanii]
MNKILIMSVLATSLSLGGCDKFKTQKDETVQTSDAAWSCTNQEHLNDLQDFLKQEYLKEVDKSLRNSRHYQADEALLKTINDGLKFQIKNIRTITQDTKATSQLECEGQVVVNFPKGLQKRAENAYLEQHNDCEGCDGEDEGYSSLNDYLEAREVALSIDNDLIKGNFKFDVLKTDKEGYTLSAEHQNAVIEAVAFVTTKAVQYEAYVNENAQIRVNQEHSSMQNAEQTELAQKAMDIRKKELEDDKKKVVDRLNQTWDRFSDEQKAQLQQDQSDWFEKRDVDCKVISQKRVYNMSESERETYQKQYEYWDDAMTAQNAQMQYDKCFTQRSNERIVYLNNVFN